MGTSSELAGEPPLAAALPYTHFHVILKNSSSWEDLCGYGAGRGCSSQQRRKEKLLDSHLKPTHQKPTSISTPPQKIISQNPSTLNMSDNAAASQTASAAASEASVSAAGTPSASGAINASGTTSGAVSGAAGGSPQSAGSQTSNSASSSELAALQAAGDAGSELPAPLYVGELSPNVSEAILFEIFSGIGPVASIRVCRDAVSHESLGYAYVNFQSGSDARRAMHELNYAQIKGRPCRIMWSQRDPSMRKNGKGNVFIKNLDPSIDNKALHDTFSAFGDILSCKVVTNHHGSSLGFGFIHFATAEAADEAIETVNGMVMNGQPVYVAHHVSRAERESQAEAQRANFTNVFVKNLSEEVDEEELKHIFGEFGEITSAVLSKGEDGKSKGFGFVNFSTHEAAQKAVEGLNDREINGKVIYAGRAQSRYERQLELKSKHEAKRMEHLTKYHGVNLYVKNLEDGIDSDKLREVFAPFGTITSARVMTDEQQKSRGFGFVCYSSPDEANRAISEMHQHMLGSKPVYVALAQRKDVRSNQMRQQSNVRNQMRLRAAAAGMPAQFVGANQLLYPGKPGFPPNARVPFGAQQMMVPRGVPPMGQWQQPAGGLKPGQRPVPGVQGPQMAMLAKQPLEKLVAGLPEEQQKQIIGEALYPRILAEEGINNELAGKLTGMILDMDNQELFALEKDDAALKEQIEAALEAYNSFVTQNQS